MRRWLGFLLATFVACEVDSDSALSALGEGCLLDSDCDGDLVCVYQICHASCRQSRDCPAGERCVRGQSGGAICQLDSESRCALHSDCPDPQLCGPDGHCRDQCRADTDCVTGQVCVSGVCADPNELVEGHLPSQENDKGEGKPCVVHSECPEELSCIEGKCLYECIANYDCPSGECKNNHCIPAPPPKPPCVPGQQVACTCPPSLPGVHICLSNGQAWTDCVCESSTGSMGGMGAGGTLGAGGMSSTSNSTSMASSTGMASSTSMASSTGMASSSAASTSVASSTSMASSTASSTIASSAMSSTVGTGGSTGVGGFGGVGGINVAGAMSVAGGLQ